MTRFRRVAAIAVLGTLLTATTAGAQDTSRAQGFFVAGAIEGVGVSTEDIDDGESGVGAGVTVGYGFTRRLALYGQFSAASVGLADDSGNYGLGHFELGVRVHFRAPTGTIVPFVQFGVSGRALRQEFGSSIVESGGTGGAFGAGLNAHFTPAIAFTTGVTWSVGTMGDVMINDVRLPNTETSMATARVHFGLIWFPQAK